MLHRYTLVNLNDYLEVILVIIVNINNSGLNNCITVPEFNYCNPAVHLECSTEIYSAAQNYSVTLFSCLLRATERIGGGPGQIQKVRPHKLIV